MINGAQQIIGNIPGRFLNPLLVAESQSADHSGFIVVVYDREPKHYDVLFLEGRVITHCARMNKDLRFFIDQQEITNTFRDHKKDSAVSLFACDRASIQRFIATFHSEPCLKVHVDSLTKAQVLALVRSTGCQLGIIERNDFSPALPVIELQELASPTKLPTFASGYSRGRLLVYDLVKNREVQSHRFAPMIPVLIRPKGRRSRKRHQPINEVQTTVPSSSPPALDAENPAEAIEALANEILGVSSLSIGNCQSVIDNLPVVTPHPSVSDHEQQSTIVSQQHSPCEGSIEAGSTPPKSRSSGTINNQPHDTSTPTPPETPASVQPEVQSTVPPEIQQPLSSSPFARTCDRLLRSFKQQVVDHCPQRAESIFASSEKKVKLLNPEFDSHAIDESNAIRVLDLIEEMVKQSPLLKRSKLREIASELVSDLYNKNFDLLESHHTIDAVEQSYYRLKGSKS